MTRAWRPAVALLTLLTLLALPAAAAPEPSEFRNAEPSAFGAVGIAAYTDAPAGQPVAFQVPLRLHPEALTQPAARYLVGFDLHDTAVDLDAVQLSRDGAQLPIERDERSDPLQPRLIVPGDAFPRDQPVDLVLSGQATASEDGQVHVGVLAIAFNAGWGTLRTTDGGEAVAYGFTLLMSEGHATSGLAPRLHGQGNDALALAPLAVLAAVTYLGLRAAYHRLHPPPPKSVQFPRLPPAPTLRPIPTAPAGPRPPRLAPPPSHLQPRPRDNDAAFIVIPRRN